MHKKYCLILLTVIGLWMTTPSRAFAVSIPPMSVGVGIGPPLAVGLTASVWPVDWLSIDLTYTEGLFSRPSALEQTFPEYQKKFLGPWTGAELSASYNYRFPDSIGGIFNLNRRVSAILRADLTWNGEGLEKNYIWERTIYKQINWLGGGFDVGFGVHYGYFDLRWMVIGIRALVPLEGFKYFDIGLRSLATLSFYFPGHNITKIE